MGAIQELASGPVPFSIETESSKPELYRFLVLTTPDEDGVYSAVALNLPGTGSCGSTKEEALERFNEAAAGVIESYRQDGEEIPWKVVAPSEIPPEARWITVHVQA